MLEEIKNIQNTPNDPSSCEEPEQDLYSEGRYLHDELAPDYDSALADTHDGQPTEDDVHEKPGAGFHIEGMHDEGERTTDGAVLNEADGSDYRDGTRETDEDIIKRSLGHVVTLSELAKSSQDTLDETDRWLAEVEADPAALEEATAAWIKQQRNL